MCRPGQRAERLSILLPLAELMLLKTVVSLYRDDRVVSEYENLDDLPIVMATRRCLGFLVLTSRFSWFIECITSEGGSSPNLEQRDFP